MDSLVRMCFAHELSVEEHYLMLGFNLSVPPYVRQGLLSRMIDNDDLLPRLCKPVLITHGAADAVVTLDVIDRQMSRIGHAHIEVLANAGHACFWDMAETYNDVLRDFVNAA